MKGVNDMKYLRSIALLRTVSKLLYEGQRTLPTLAQVKSANLIVEVAIKEVMSSLSQMGQLQIATSINDLRAGFKVILDSNACSVRDAILKCILSKDFATVKEYATALTDAGVDMQIVNELCEAQDFTRLYNYFCSLENRANISRASIYNILKGVRDLNRILCNYAYDECNSEPVLVTDKIYPLLRYVCAIRNRVDPKYA